jgi:hypothetical protein
LLMLSVRRRSTIFTTNEESDGNPD